LPAAIWRDDDGRLKQPLAQQFPSDIQGYMAGKHDLIQTLSQKAQFWQDFSQP
jgi:GrpB-like predicted nucleotidyltransferase (UPF0157 family)